MEKMITRKEAAAFLGISITTLDIARTKGQISYIQYVPNGCVYFTRNSLLDYINRNTHKNHPIEVKATYRKPRQIRIR